MPQRSRMHPLESYVEDTFRRVLREELQRALREAPKAAGDERVCITVAAARSGYGVATIRDWAARGLIKRYGRGRNARYSLAEVLAVGPEQGAGIDAEAEASRMLRDLA